ncbi:MAG: hypothetical protein AAFZ65_13695 [Planctomycetota bacterium]
MTTFAHLRSCVGIALLGALAGCGSTPDNDSQLDLPPPPPRLTTGPWTDAFVQEAVLIADRIEIRGPDRIADQLVAHQDPASIAFASATTSEGLVHTYRAIAPRARAAAQLDQWQLVALRELVVVQEPGEVDVRIRALGQAFFQVVGETDERRGPELTFRGVVGWPGREPDGSGRED